MHTGYSMGDVCMRRLALASIALLLPPPVALLLAIARFFPHCSQLSITWQAHSPSRPSPAPLAQSIMSSADQQYYADKAAKAEARAEKHAHEQVGRGKHHVHAKATHVVEKENHKEIQTHDSKNSNEKHKAHLKHQAAKHGGKHTSSA